MLYVVSELFACCYEATEWYLFVTEYVDNSLVVAFHTIDLDSIRKAYVSTSRKNQDLLSLSLSQHC